MRHESTAHLPRLATPCCRFSFSFIPPDATRDWRVICTPSRSCCGDADQLNQLLRHHGIEPEDSLGQPFDPHRHEALRVDHDASKPDHTILVFQRGYRRGNEVFRRAKVVVNDLSDAGLTGHEV
jgi:hypothetical protein